MKWSHDVISISDEDDDDPRDEVDKTLRLSNIGDQYGVETMDLDHSEKAPSGSLDNSVNLYNMCLVEILEVFPDISQMYVQRLYGQHVALAKPSDQLEGTVAQLLIDKILDERTYPKEKDTAKDLKRKRSTASLDDEEAVKWKRMERGPDSEAYVDVA